MRLLVCGSRNFTAVDCLYDLLDDILDEFPISVLIHGDARGADRLAEKWAESHYIEVLPYPADWNTHHKAAGPIRNRKMLTEGNPDLVFAFFKGYLSESKGTADMVRAAKKAKVSIRIAQCFA